MCCVCVYVGLDPDDYESEEKSDKSKNPNSIQSGKWQLGFQGDFILQNLKIFFSNGEIRTRKEWDWGRLSEWNSLCFVWTRSITGLIDDLWIAAVVTFVFVMCIHNIMAQIIIPITSSV